MVAQRPAKRAVFGLGTLDHTRTVMPEVRARVAQFLAPGAPEPARRALIADWCVDYVFCPVTAPVARETLAELRGHGWLEEVASAEGGAMFKVRR